MMMPARARGILGMALTWAVGLTGLATSLLVGGVLLDIVPASVYGIRELVAVAVRAFVVGGAAGALYAMVLARHERATTFGALRRGRVAAWGFVAAAGVASALTLAASGVLPAMILIPAVLIAGTLGAGAAVGVLVLARRADARLRPGEDGGRSSLPLNGRGDR
jgi:hypothetical protein